MASSISASTTILLDEPKELKAIFKLDTEGTGSSGSGGGTSSSNNSYLLVVTENEKSFGDVTGSGFYGNEYVSIQATAFNGYEFVRWDGDEIADQYAEETQVLVNKNKTVTAHFKSLVFLMTLLMLEMVGGAVETLASSLKYKEQNGFFMKPWPGS